ncbi:MAG: addiction module toxin, RelE/StbE family [Firmicutes bacterium]|nr:addiction module toxin, RelE/StbE family [Bacillota bacterium]
MKLRINPVAMQDMQDIKMYITSELQNPDAAVKILQKIIAAYKRLPEFPLRSYIIFYKVEGEYISIYRVLYGRRDYVKILFGKLPDDE